MQFLKKTEKWEIEEDPDVVMKVREAQIQQLYRQTPGGLAGIMIIMFAVCIALWQVIPHWKLQMWSGAVILLTISRGFSVAAFQRRAPSGEDIFRWAKMHALEAGATALMWALSPLFLWPAHSPVHQMIWPICIVALAASVVAKYCIWTPSYLPYLILSVAPISLRLILEGGLIYIILGLLGAVLTVVLAQTGRMMHKSGVRALEMSIRNEALSSFLSAEKAKEEKLNSQLQIEIKERIRSHEELQSRNQELESLNAQLNTTKDNLESTNKELERALSDIKQLSGMLPICASCKKIRNDSGYWQQIETYIRDHSKVEFSHSICPDCAAKLYPDLYNKK